MASINKAIILGYVGDEPKITTTPAGKKVANLAIATTEKGYTSQSGVVYPDKTEWHNITIWQKQAETLQLLDRKVESNASNTNVANTQGNKGEVPF
jgi:single-stranded DNA-binding protein|nr:MAG TPA: Single strand binding protein [Caudoviricetes sp.]